MSDLITVQGVVLSAMPVGEYDRRIVLLTREKGKIAVFCRGARRMNSPFMAASSPFVFGDFTLYEGRSSYNLNHVDIRHQFSSLASLQPGIYYGYYFLELADYFGREGTDEKEMMNLLYVSAKALLNPAIRDRLVCCIFEFRTMTIQGMMPEIYSCLSCGKKLSVEDDLYFSMSEHGAFCGKAHPLPPDAFRISYVALYTLQYIAAAPMTKLYGFEAAESLLQELESIIHTYTDANTDRKFRSLDVLEAMVPDQI